MDALVNVAVPVFGIVVLGYLAGRLGILGADSAAALNKFVYYFALPPVLFVFTARAPIDKVLNWPFLAAFLGGSLITLVIALIIGRLWFRHSLELLTIHGLTAIFANTAYMGVPLFLTAFGPQGVLPAIVSTLATTTIFIGGAIAALETSRATGTSAVQMFGQVTRTLVFNPLLISPFLGIAFSYFAIPIPKPLGNFLDLLAASAGPGALFALGLSLVGRQLLGDLFEVSWLVVLKLIVHPAVTYLLVTYVFVMDPVWSKAAVLLAALPVGALVFVVAQQYNVFIQRASSAIVLTTALSLATMSALLVAFGVG
ncbi:MAG: AEC family transporter [Hyphomicrobiaceae bacterium]|nr:AEC family transporter [Hyphomicrobiaceae bacterium]